MVDVPPSPSDSLSVEVEASIDGNGSGFVVVDGVFERRQGRDRVLLRGQPDVDQGDVVASAQRVLTPKDRRHQHPNELSSHAKQDAVSVLSQVQHKYT